MTGDWIWGNIYGRKVNINFFQSQWGIVIWLEAGWKIVSDTGDKGKYMEVADHIYFQPMLLSYPDSQNLTADELQYFCDGLKLISEYICKLLQEDSCLIIALRCIQFSDCHIQIEGFKASAIQWASETFDFPMPTIETHFDRLRFRNGMYIFDFSSI